MFNSPDMLWWAGAAGIPVVIHLLSRRRYRRVAWAAMDFLNRAFKKTHRRLRIENLLLLLLRMLLLMLLATALADPQMASSAIFGDAAAGSQNVLIVMDTSFSMDLRDQADGSPFEKGRTAALQILDDLESEDDAAALVTAGQPAHLVIPLSRNLDIVASSLRSMEVTHASTDTIGALKVVAGVLQEPDRNRDFPGSTTVYVVTDMQKFPLLAPPKTVEDESGGTREIRSESPDAAVENVLREIVDAGARTLFIDVGSDNTNSNVAITNLQHVGRALVRGVTTKFECRIRNFGSETVGGEVRFFVDNDEQWTQQEQVLDLKGTGTGTTSETEATFTFSGEFKTSGWHWVGVRYMDDALKTDNVRRFAFYVRDAIKVLTVNGTKSREAWDSATFYIARALDPFLGHGGEGGSSFNIRDVDLVNFAHEDLSDHDVVIMANVAQLSAAKIRELETFVDGGGSLLFFVGQNFEVAGTLGSTGGSANSLFYRQGRGLLPGPLVRTVGSDEFNESPYFMQFQDLDHPAMRYFRDEKIRPAITRMPVNKLIELNIPPDAENHRILTWFRQENGEKLFPAIIEQPFGKGNVILVTTTADTKWNYYGTTPGYVPLVKELTYYMARISGRHNLTVGEKHVARFDPTVKRVIVATGSEPGEERPTSLSPDKSFSEIDLGRIEKSGVIRIQVAPGQLDGNPSPARSERLVAVNVDPAESDLDRADANYMSTQLGTDLVEVVSDMAALEDNASSQNNAGIWKTLLYAVLGCLLVETLLAQRFSRTRRMDAAA